jgi:hypothetical protein
VLLRLANLSVTNVFALLRPENGSAMAVSGPGREQGGYQAGAGKNGCGVPLAR